MMKRTVIIVSLMLISLGSIMFVLKDSKEPEASNLFQNSFPLLSLKSGDLVLRHGKGFISSSFMKFSLQDPRYSHAGLLSIEGGLPYVYHAIGGEENEDNRLRKDLLSDFCDSRNVYAYGIFRYDLNPREIKTEDSLVKLNYSRQLQFDTSLDLATDDRMYCSEFIYKVLQIAAPNKNIITLSRISGKEYVAIDNLYLNSFCKLIYSHSYNGIATLSKEIPTGK